MAVISDLDYVEKAYLHCVYCRERLTHRRTDISRFDTEDRSETVMTFRCRVCENKVDVPSRRFAHGVLSHFLVRR